MHAYPLGASAASKIGRPAATSCANSRVRSVSKRVIMNDGRNETNESSMVTAKTPVARIEVATVVQGSVMIGLLRRDDLDVGCEGVWNGRSGFKIRYGRVLEKMEMAVVAARATGRTL